MFRPVFVVDSRVDWTILSLNENAIPILVKHINKVQPNPFRRPAFVVDKRVDWKYLSSNPNAILILEHNLKKVNWEYLSLNPNAIHLLERQLDKVHWSHLSYNQSAIPLLEKHLDKVDWSMLSTNPNAIHLFVRLDTEQMRANCKSFAEELVQYVLHPLRVQRMADAYGLDMEEYMDLV